MSNTSIKAKVMVFSCSAVRQRNRNEYKDCNGLLRIVEQNHEEIK